MSKSSQWFIAFLFCLFPHSLASGINDLLPRLLLVIITSGMLTWCLLKFSDARVEEHENLRSNVEDSEDKTSGENTQ